jgi:hypothetical protein
LNATIANTPVNTNLGGQTSISKTTAGDIYGAGMPNTEAAINAVDLRPITTAPGINAGPGVGLGYDAQGNYINPATGKPYAPPGVNLSYDAAGNIIGDTGTGLGTGVNLVNPETGALVSPPTTSVTPPPTGLFGNIQNVTGLSPWQQAAVVGGAGLGVIGANVIPNMLNPDIKQETYPDVNLSSTSKNTNMLGMPDWWNSLYGRGGYGAGNYLGYDILRGLNIPADVQSLLGINSGQNTGSSLIA